LVAQVQIIINFEEVFNKVTIPVLPDGNIHSLSLYKK
jgi:hypothetical protein